MYVSCLLVLVKYPVDWEEVHWIAGGLCTDVGADLNDRVWIARLANLSRLRRPASLDLPF
jgi:hypothetical protein